MHPSMPIGTCLTNLSLAYVRSRQHIVRVARRVMPAVSSCWRLQRAPVLWKTSVPYYIAFFFHLMSAQLRAFPLQILSSARAEDRDPWRRDRLRSNRSSLVVGISASGSESACEALRSACGLSRFENAANCRHGARLISRSGSSRHGARLISRSGRVAFRLLIAFNPVGRERFIERPAREGSESAAY
jgi:hypothetical protein